MVRRGVKVKALERSDKGWRALIDSGASFGGQEAFLATGEHELRGFTGRRGLQNDLVAFKLHWRLRPEQAAALNGVVELMLFSGGYAGA